MPAKGGEYSARVGWGWRRESGCGLETELGGEVCDEVLVLGAGCHNGENAGFHGGDRGHAGDGIGGMAVRVVDTYSPGKGLIVWLVVWLLIELVRGSGGHDCRII